MLLSIQIFVLIIANVAIYFLVKKILLQKEDGAMRFLIINIAKDFFWMIWLVFTAEKDRNSFFIIIGSFLLLSFMLYYFVVRAFNRNN